jgi:hypothetical protein
VVRTFLTVTRDLEALRDWLKAVGTTHVGMESTGVYWRPVYAVLEGHFDLIVGNARHIRNVPGRKTDVKDVEWIADLVARAGLLIGVANHRRNSQPQHGRRAKGSDKTLRPATIFIHNGAPAGAGWLLSGGWPSSSAIPPGASASHRLGSYNCGYAAVVHLLKLSNGTTPGSGVLATLFVMCTGPAYAIRGRPRRGACERAKGIRGEGDGQIVAGMGMIACSDQGRP